MFAANPEDCPSEADQAGVLCSRGEIYGNGGECRENHQPTAAKTAAQRKCERNTAET